MNEENIRTYDMTVTPYQVNALSSSTDNSDRDVDTNAVNVWYRNVAFTSANDPAYTKLFSQPSVNWMSAQITLRLKGVHPDGKNIVVPDYTILSVADSFYQGTQLTIEMLQEMVILHIVDQIRNDYQLTQQNDKLSIWVTNYNMDSGLRKFNDYKMNEKRGTYFHSWNY
jgi:hypothetical protein